MKLLIVTQSVDLENPVLGFFHRWLIEFAKNCQSVTIICLEEGEHDLPENVKVLSLGKESEQREQGSMGKKQSQRKLRYLARFYKYIWQERKNYDAVFVHMNPIYVVLGGLFWKIQKKKIALWYTHRAVDFKLRMAEKLADKIFTASKESFQLASKKVVIAGHGIDVARYASQARVKKIGSEPLRLLHVGRITPIKNCNTLVEAARILAGGWKEKFQVLFIGGPVTDADQEYEKRLYALIDTYKLGEVVRLVGTVSHEELPKYYASADASINLTPTGGVDKSVLESMAAGVPVLASNKTFIEYFGSHWTELIFQERDTEDLAAKIMKLFGSNDLHKISTDLQKVAQERTDVSVLIKKIVTEINNGKKS